MIYGNGSICFSILVIFFIGQIAVAVRHGLREGEAGVVVIRDHILIMVLSEYSLTSSSDITTATYSLLWSWSSTNRYLVEKVPAPCHRNLFLDSDILTRSTKKKYYVLKKQNSY